jgi:hypothetical protein
LSDNNQGNNWTDNVEQNGNGCTFKGGAYHILSGKGFIHSCSINSYQDFAFQARMTVLKGDCGSLVFREDSNSNYYAFSVCQDGSYFLNFYTNNQIDLISSSSSAITSGLNQPNVIAVVAKGHHIDLYVNNHHLNGIDDNRSGSGSIGFAANAFNNTTEVAFNDAKLWKL